MAKRKKGAMLGVNPQAALEKAISKRLVKGKNDPTPPRQTSGKASGGRRGSNDEIKNKAVSRAEGQYARSTSGAFTRNPTRNSGSSNASNSGSNKGEYRSGGGIGMGDGPNWRDRFGSNVGKTKSKSRRAQGTGASPFSRGAGNRRSAPTGAVTTGRRGNPGKGQGQRRK